MNKTIGLNPLVTILLLLIGAKLAAVPGAVLAIPVYLSIESVAKVLYPSTTPLSRIKQKPEKPVS